MSMLKHLIGAAAMLAGLAAVAAEPPLQLSWGQLVPIEKPGTRPPKPFFSGATPVQPGQAPQLPTSHGATSGAGDDKWMSGANKAPASNTPAPVATELNGKRVKLGGYVVPLDFSATKVTEFLLVPFVGACIHVPPPPANQIVYIKSKTGIALKGQFDPVYVTGILSTDPQFTGLADTGYSLTAEVIEHRAE